MVVNQMFSQTELTTTRSLQCPALKIFLNISFRPLSFFQHTSYVSHIRQPIKMWLSISYAESVRLYGPLNMTVSMPKAMASLIPKICPAKNYERSRRVRFDSVTP